MWTKTSLLVLLMLNASQHKLRVIKYLKTGRIYAFGLELSLNVIESTQKDFYVLGTVWIFALSAERA